MILYLNVPFTEKDEAKALGAKFNNKLKKWYIQTPQADYTKYAKWILKDCAEATIPFEYIYILETHRTCWKCGKETTIIGLGVGEHISLYKEDDIVYQEINEDLVGTENSIHLAWADDENDIPPAILDYIKKHYSVKTGYSKQLNSKCFANHCEHCNALQGNWFLFNEPDSPLSSCAEGQHLISRMQQLKIKEIALEDNIILNWQVSYCPNDYAYLKYGNIEELHLSSNPNNDGITYEELYRIPCNHLKTD